MHSLSSMTLLNILGDGSVYPPLRQNDLVIMLNKGSVAIGKFLKENFVKNDTSFIVEPSNRDELLINVVSIINDEMPYLYEKKHAVYILCPQNIAADADWMGLQKMHA